SPHLLSNHTTSKLDLPFPVDGGEPPFPRRLAQIDGRGASVSFLFFPLILIGFPLLSPSCDYNSISPPPISHCENSISHSREISVSRMSVTLAYHVEGKFITVGLDLVYEGGEVVTITQVDPDLMNLFYLKAPMKSRLSYSCGVQLYFKVPKQHGVSKFWLINNDDSVLDMLTTYKNMENYSIYVEQQAEDDLVVEEDDDGGEDSDVGDDDASEDHDLYSDIGSWISEEDMEELEAVKTKVKEEKKDLQGGIRFAILDDDADDSDGFGSNEIAYYEKTNSEDEVAYHGVRSQKTTRQVQSEYRHSIFLLLG
ncbi:hypothetical protein LINPERHAP2_LOCUS5596, partial [Linum perenne]